MAKQITITGDNAIAEKRRYDALTEINKLDTQTLERLSQLAQSSKAKNYIKNKWLLVKGYLGVK